MYSDNIMWMLNDASSDAVESGRAWYPLARRWCYAKADEYGVRPVVVAALISALSPRNRWERNLYDAEQVLLNYAEGFHHPFNVMSATFRKNVEKAWNVITLDDPGLVTTSPKTEAFVDNIIDPLSKLVTVDVWAHRVCMGDMTMKAKSIGRKQYAKYSLAFTRVAQEVGLRPYEVQAITWVEIKNRSKKYKKSGMIQKRLL